MADEPLDLFAIAEPTSQLFSCLDLPRYRQQLAGLADQGVFIGTSSWKYPGWCGLIYDEQRVFDP
jgi:hypothetical protein